jgi:hypothetical protein
MVGISIGRRLLFGLIFLLCRGWSGHGLRGDIISITLRGSFIKPNPAAIPGIDGYGEKTDREPRRRVPPLERK